MVGEFQTANICLYATYLQPRTITAPFRERHPVPATAVCRKEDASAALDVFDKTIWRTKRLISYLDGNGYDITTVADNLRQLEDLRGDLNRAFISPQRDLRRQLLNIFEIRVVGLCSAIRSLKDTEHTGTTGQYPNPTGGKVTVLPLRAGVSLSAKCDGA